MPAMIRSALSVLTTVVLGCNGHRSATTAPSPAAGPDAGATTRLDASAPLDATRGAMKLTGLRRAARRAPKAAPTSARAPRLTPIEDEAVARSAKYLGVDDATGAGLSGQRAYIRLRSDVHDAAVDALVRTAPVGVEVRALVAKPRARRVGEFSGECHAALRALEPAPRGFDARTLGPAMADALGDCGCRARDLDGFVSLFAWLVVPRPELGWIPIADLSRAPTSPTSPGAP